MLSFGIASAATPTVPRAKKSRWDAGGAKTVIPNVACILPPDLKPDLLHAYLLRFQFEEVQYKLSHLEDEQRNVNFGENLMSNFTLDNKLQVTPDVRARDALVQERRQITESIEKVYPVFRAPFAIRASLTKSVKRVDVPSIKLLGVILGPRAAMLRQIEKEFNVKISVRGAARDDENSSSGERNHLLIIGNTDDEVERCCRRINAIISSEGVVVNQNLFSQDVDPDSFALSFDPNEERPPWAEGDAAQDSAHSTFDSAYNELLRNISRGDEDEEPEEVRALFDRFATDLARRDISALMDEPLPPGAE